MREDISRKLTLNTGQETSIFMIINLPHSPHYGLLKSSRAQITPIDYPDYNPENNILKRSNFLVFKNQNIVSDSINDTVVKRFDNQESLIYIFDPYMSIDNGLKEVKLVFLHTNSAYLQLLLFVIIQVYCNMKVLKSIYYTEELDQPNNIKINYIMDHTKYTTYVIISFITIQIHLFIEMVFKIFRNIKQYTQTNMEI
jgi:hypothetical protein